MFLEHGAGQLEDPPGGLNGPSLILSVRSHRDREHLFREQNVHVCLYFCQSKIGLSDGLVYPGE